MNDPLCLVCGQPLSTHRLQLWFGVAHTVAPDGSTCSRNEGERLGFVAQINTLRTIIRSLRWRAGRLRTRNERWDDKSLLRYSDHWQQQLDRYLAIIDEYYPRHPRKDKAT